ncbi:MAG: insulinase family protein [Syntrophaceae bacterium]|nr:insulinase family protein [Syntrophaceae bacterium]
MMTSPDRRLVLLILSALLLWGGIAQAEDLEGRVLRKILPNGLTVLLLERPLSPTVSLYIRYRAGAADDPDGRTGTAHLLEHMLFKGTETIGPLDPAGDAELLERIFQVGGELDRERARGDQADTGKVKDLIARLEDLQSRHRKTFKSNEIDRLYSMNGAVGLNASTGQDVTTYHVSLPMNRIELWARIESDRMIRPVFREFYAERDVVQEERRQRTDTDPGGLLYERFMAAAFISHPYRRPILGWPSDLAFLDPTVLRSFLLHHHAPNNTVIAVVGRIRTDDVIRLIERYFGDIPRQAPLFGHLTEELTQRGERRVRVEFDARPQVMIGWHKPALPHFDDYVFDVIEALLSRGRTSRFYQKLVEETGVAESAAAASSLPGSRYPNLFVFFGTPRDPHTPEALEKAVQAEIAILQKEPVPEKELEKVKNRMRADYIRELASNEGLASKLSYYEAIAGDWRYITGHLKVIDRITPADVQRVARTYLVPENRTVGVLEKKP